MTTINRVILVLTTFFFLGSERLLALDWKIRPRVNLSQTYSDNINLSSSNQRSALVTELNPGVTVNAQSAFNKFDFNYQLQSIYNAEGESGIDINNQLQMNSQYEFIDRRLFLETSSSISQQNISNRRIVGDNISGNNNSTNVYTFRVSPYWTPHFSNFAQGDFRVSYDRVSNDGDTTDTENDLSESDTFTQNFRLSSGSDFSYVNWVLVFNNTSRQNQGGENVDFQNSSAEVSYAIDRKFSVFARVEQSSNSFASNSDSNENGVSYTVGGHWRPSRRYGLEAGFGNNYFITLNASPFDRLNFSVTYRNNDIGLNRGDTWTSSLTYRRKRSTLNFSYTEDTVTTQQLLLDQPVFGDFTDGIGDDGRNIRLPSLTDEVFVTKNASLSYTYQSGKSDVSMTLFHTQREFEQSLDEEDVTGISGSWNWQFSNRTSTLLRLSWQETESVGTENFSDERLDVSFNIRRNILARLTGTIEYRFVDQSSDDNLNDYIENRITANLVYQY